MKKEPIVFLFVFGIFFIAFSIYQTPLGRAATLSNQVNLNSLSSSLGSNIFRNLFGGLGGLSGGGGAGGSWGGSSVSSGSGNPLTFGGRIGGITLCTCSGGRALSIGPPKGGSLLLGPGSRIYAYGRIAPGMWVLGDYSGGGICFVRVGKYCIPVPVKGTIIKIGTS